MAKLVCQAGAQAGHEFSLTADSNIFGRQSSNDFQINDPKASREHFNIKQYGQVWMIQDLKSRNGTRVNGKKVSDRILEFGDVIKVGACELCLVKNDGDRDLNELISKYDLEEKIGEGGMGIVYRASQTSMDRTVALKILSPKLSARQKFIDQFIQEARAAGALNHPNIIQVHDVGSENNIHYFSMEFVEGPTCKELLREQGALDENLALEIILQTAKALEYAHDNKLVHRDIKPDNIMVSPDKTVKIADLGISKSTDELEEEQSRTITGTPHYMAPEVAKGDKADSRIDIYSLGATFYHLLTDDLPYNGGNITELLKAHVTDPIPDPLEHGADCSNASAELCMNMMAKKPDDRPQSASEIIEIVEEILEKNGGRSGGETVILQKLASGKSGRLESDPGTKTPTSASMTREKSGSTEVDAEPAKSLILPIAMITAVLVLGIIIFLNLPSDEEDSDTPQNNSTNNNTTSPVIIEDDDSDNNQTNNSSNDNPNTTAQDNTSNVPSEPTVDFAALRTQIEDLRNRARAPGLDFGQMRLLMREVSQLEQEPLNNSLQKHLELVRSGLEQSILQERKNQARQEYAQLEPELFSLIDSKDFNKALDRLDIFLQKHDGFTSVSMQTQRATLLQKRDYYTSSVKRKIQQYIENKDTTELRALRSELPPSMSNGELGKLINEALQNLASAETEHYKDITKQVRHALAEWDLSKVEILFKEYREDLGDTPYGKELDTYLALTEKLRHMISDINDGLGYKAPYRGTIRYADNPYLWGASQPNENDGGGLVIIPAEGGQSVIKWRFLDKDILEKVLSIATPDKTDEHTPCVNEIIRLMTAVELEEE